MTRSARAACGYFHTVLVAESGAVYTFGNNEHLQLGYDSDGSETVHKPTRVNLRGALMVARASESSSGATPAPDDTYDDAVVAVACGHSHTVALTVQGRVVAWGKNVNWQLGTGSLAECALPTVVSFFDPRFDRVTTICCGAEFTLASTELGRIFGWGSNQYGIFGADAHSHKYALPLEISFFRNDARALVAGIACGAQHVLVLDDAERVWAAGFNADGQLGVPNQKEYAGFQEVPLRRVAGGAGKPVAVFCGREHSGCALEDGSVWVWGFNGAGELGLGTRVNVFAPTRVTLPFTVSRFGGYVCSVWEDDHTAREAVRRQALHLQGERARPSVRACADTVMADQWTRFDELRMLFSIDSVAVAREKAQRLLAAAQAAAAAGDGGHGETAAGAAATAAHPAKRKVKRKNTLTADGVATAAAAASASAATTDAAAAAADAADKTKLHRDSQHGHHGHHSKTHHEKCPKCSKKLKDGSLFCVHCGYKVVVEPPVLSVSAGAVPNEAAAAAADAGGEPKTPPTSTGSLSAPMPRMSALQKALLEIASPAPMRQDVPADEPPKRSGKK